MSRHRAPRGGDIDRDTSAMLRDPRHRPVLLYVASPPRVTGPPRAPLLVTIGTSLALVALLTLTLVSAWRGWQMAWSDSGTATPSAAPLVPAVPRVDADMPVTPALPASPGASTPSGTPRAEDPQDGAGQVVEESSGQPYVATTVVATAVPGGGLPARRTDPVDGAAPATPTTPLSAAPTAADPAPVRPTAAKAAPATASTAVAPSRSAATASASATSTDAASSTAAPVAARSEDACPRSPAPDRPSLAAEARDRSEEEWSRDDARVERREHDDEPHGG